jgi:hypothetical protein
MKSWEDGFGNLFFQVGEQNKVMFTSHTDTVHHKDGKQEVFIDHDNILFVTEGVLGADDGSGNWLMLEMIKDGVEATYCFYRGEERGGLGSTYSVTNDAAFYSQYDIAIAFDRKGTGSIVIEQGAGECASREFALTLESALQMGYSPDPTGVFTDTATIAELVPECVNLSVGYDQEHTSAESQDTDFLFKLRDALCKVDWTNTEFTIKRKAGDFGDVLTGAYSDYLYEDYGYDNVSSIDASVAMMAPSDVTYEDLYGLTRTEVSSQLSYLRDTEIVDLVTHLVTRNELLDEKLEGAERLLSEFGI